jgi:hypothetical protein
MVTKGIPGVRARLIMALQRISFAGWQIGETRFCEWRNCKPLYGVMGICFMCVCGGGAVKFQNFQKKIGNPKTNH